MTYEADSGDFEIALGGDSILTRRLQVFREDRFLGLRDLWRSSDAGFINLESGVVHRYLEGHHNVGGMYMTTEPHLLEDLRWLGVNMVSSAGTHSFDYGQEGILTTMGHLDEAQIAHAGTGRHLREARSPAYLDTPRGRVALIACTAHVRPWAVAGDQRPDTNGRPGYSPLRWRTVYSVPQDVLEMARKLGGLVGTGGDNNGMTEGGSVSFDNLDADYELFGQAFRQGDAVQVDTVPHTGDVEDIVRHVREARNMADYVVLSMHSHERKFRDREEAAGFVRQFARRVLDEGADVFAGHGGQALGIEIYKGKPIFYDLGHFIDQRETVRYLPAEVYARYGLDYDAAPSEVYAHRYGGRARQLPADREAPLHVFAKCLYAGGSLKEIRLYPLDLGDDSARSQRGRPMLAAQEAGRQVLERLSALCSRYGTTLETTKDYGVIQV